MTASELSRLVALDISKTTDAFLDLPLPEESPLIDAAPKMLRRAADSFYRSWSYLASAKELYLRGEALSGRDLWWQLFFVVGAYYDFSIRLLLRKQTVFPLPGLALEKAKEWFDRENKQIGTILREFSSLVERDLPEEEAEQLRTELLSRFNSTATNVNEATDAILWESDRSLAAFFAGTYITALSTAVMAELLRRTDMPLDQIEVCDGLSHQMAASLFGRRPSSTDGWPPHVFELPQRLLATVFEQWVRIYERPYPVDLRRGGPFSSIRLAELAPLANRDARMGKKYGNKRIEKVFEQQLALIVQSFGLYVVSTRTGQRTVDLICISADPTARFTFLLEAKTSARPYALPRDDARALLEYIRETRSGLTTLPPLHFVLMIGPSPSATLDKKLQGLEAEAGLPIRYCSADELAQLREVVAGPLPLNDFADHLLLASRVVPAGFAQTMRSRVDELRSSHEALVRTLLAPVR